MFVCPGVILLIYGVSGKLNMCYIAVGKIIEWKRILGFGKERDWSSGQTNSSVSIKAFMVSTTECRVGREWNFFSKLHTSPWAVQSRTKFKKIYVNNEGKSILYLEKKKKKSQRCFRKWRGSVKFWCQSSW